MAKIKPIFLIIITVGVTLNLTSTVFGMISECKFPEESEIVCNYGYPADRYNAGIAMQTGNKLVFINRNGLRITDNQQDLSKFETIDTIINGSDDNQDVMYTINSNTDEPYGVCYPTFQQHNKILQYQQYNKLLIIIPSVKKVFKITTITMLEQNNNKIASTTGNSLTSQPYPPQPDQTVLTTTVVPIATTVTHNNNPTDDNDSLENEQKYQGNLNNSQQEFIDVDVEQQKTLLAYYKSLKDEQKSQDNLNSEKEFVNVDIKNEQTRLASCKSRNEEQKNKRSWLAYFTLKKGLLGCSIIAAIIIAIHYMM